MLAQFHNRRFYIVLTADLVIFVTVFIGAYLLRFDFILDPFYRAQILRLAPFLLPGKTLIFFFFGLYRGMWRYTSLNDFWRLGQASLLSMIYYIVATLCFYGFQGIPRSIFLLDAILTFLVIGGLRIGIRLFYRAANSSEGLWPFCYWSLRSPRSEAKSVLIVGAGGAGEKMLREIFDNQHLDYHVVGFLDDDRTKWGRSLHGLQVFGGVDMLPEIVGWEKINEVLIAIPRSTGAQMRRVIEICKSCNVSYRTLPEIGAIIDGKVSIKSLRDVKYEDLLRRPPVRLDIAEISCYLQEKRVLVTGAGGSIGSELCRQIIRFDPKELILVDASEVNLFNLQMELKHELNFHQYQCILSRVQDQPLMNDVFSKYRPHLIFHAAAYKHVPLLEINPWEAISNNVLGSQVVMDLSLQYGVERFVLVSTDKAVRPTNVMGASKRLAELILQSRQGNGVRFMAVRFGNVIGSSGSVLPLFRRQLEQGGPITVTHPEVTRYFMTITEAAQLILQAAGLGEGGEIFILEMGTPVNIAKMAEELVRLSGKKPGKDVEIIFTGLREGEKLYEELITQGEGVVNTKHEKIMVLRPNGWNGKNSQGEFTQCLDAALEDLYRIVNSHDAQAIRSKLGEILHEYVAQCNIQDVLQLNRAASDAVSPIKALAGGTAAQDESAPAPDGKKVALVC
ncbi:MAG: nucleoside-diphosphate sugar epimerase/dehydratase [Deltaproteobacteria bacterium]|nr:nucleoside-diphosphate sugar epimerase/dehydratase [Deltaproteobacteria bacterium]